MFFYIDESGNTGNNLFDGTQPVLSYGLLSCQTNLDIRACGVHAQMLRRLGVASLHANELREEGLAAIGDLLFKLHKGLRFDFDYYFINKRDFALVTFFDHVFDDVLNPAVPWMLYQTPMRYVALVKLAALFDEELLARTWRAATTLNRDESLAALAEIFPELLARIEGSPLDSRSKEIFTQTFTWAHDFPAHLDFHASSKWQTHYMGPNLVGFQFVLRAIARRLKAKNRKDALSIVVDRQHQYNKIQRDLQTHYERISASIVKEPFPVQRYLDRDINEDYANMPARPFNVSASGESIGLQLTDVCLWLANRFMRSGEVHPALAPFLRRLLTRSFADGIHMRGFEQRWLEFEKKLPAFEDCDREQIRRLMAEQEAHRQAAVQRHRAATRYDEQEKNSAFEMSPMDARW